VNDLRWDFLVDDFFKYRHATIVSIARRFVYKLASPNDISAAPK